MFKFKKMSLVLLLACVSLVFSQVDPRRDTSVYVSSVQNYSNAKNTVGLEDYISIKVNGLNKLVNGSTSPLTLYLNGMPMTGIAPVFVDTVQGYTVFQLSKTDSASKFWDVFYHKSARKSIIPVDISVGINDKGAIKGASSKMYLKLYDRVLLWGMLVVFIFMVFGFVVLSKKSIIVRDGKIGDKMSTFSLAKSQLAFWTLIIVGSVGYIFAITGDMPLITGSTLILLAVSIGTTVGASLIGGSKNKVILNESKGFFIDILSDDDGVSIHRFQMVVWTVFIGIYFIYSVFNGLDIPQISKELLALMGISSGTYLGLKIPEGKSSEVKDDTQDDVVTPPPVTQTPDSQVKG